MEKGTGRYSKGFTLIELMIVIAIIGILAAIAIPNYIHYRENTFCSMAESDADSLSGGLANYFASPGNISFSGASGHSINFPGNSTVTLSGDNTATITPTGSTTFKISVTDQSGRCTLSYRKLDSHWTTTAKGVFTATF